MQQGSFTNINWQTGNQFFGYIKDDLIYSYEGNVIGVRIEKYKEVEQGLLKCKNRLIELGEIKVPKTQDEIIKEQSEMIDKQQALLKEMLAKFEGVKDERTADVIKPDSKRKATASAANGNKPNPKSKPEGNNEPAGLR